MADLKVTTLDGHVHAVTNDTFLIVNASRRRFEDKASMLKFAEENRHLRPGFISAGITAMTGQPRQLQSRA